MSEPYESTPSATTGRWENSLHIRSEPHELRRDRDHFAAQAMQGICAHPDTWGLNVQSIAVKAYDLAEAMIRERAERQERNHAKMFVWMEQHEADAMLKATEDR